MNLAMDLAELEEVRIGWYLKKKIETAEYAELNRTGIFYLVNKDGTPMSATQAANEIPWHSGYMLTKRIHEMFPVTNAPAKIHRNGRTRRPVYFTVDDTELEKTRARLEKSV